MNPAIHFKSLRRTSITAVIVISLAAAVAFALLQGRSVLTGNTISTASANLFVSTDGVNYSQAIPGFSFDNVVPGGWPVPADGYSIYLKNAGTTVLDLKLSLDSMPSNPSSADLSKITIALTEFGSGIPPRGFILGSLMNGGQPIEGELAPDAVRQYKLQALADDDAQTGAVINDIDLTFTGTPRDPNEP